MQDFFAIYCFETLPIGSVIDSPTLFDLSLRHIPSLHRLASANPIIRPQEKLSFLING